MKNCFIVMKVKGLSNIQQLMITYEYSFVFFSWIRIPSMDVVRAYASATTDKNDNLWISGGTTVNLKQKSRISPKLIKLLIFK
jgi:hypothetical protein